MKMLVLFLIFILSSLTVYAQSDKEVRSFEVTARMRASYDELSDLSAGMECRDTVYKAKDKAQKICTKYGFQTYTDTIATCDRSKVYGFYLGQTFIGHPGVFKVNLRFNCK